ncbi:hypothetical protein IWX86_000704 [Polaromonas sp. CG_9.2]|nr:hypothetical protein [Polaromonas sp. CG_9.2]MDH6186432.1 hypothetical protein [Polaromonas sp. CG_23.6]
MTSCAACTTGAPDRRDVKRAKARRIPHGAGDKDNGMTGSGFA